MSGLQEVVVTAQKRVENLQNVPISVQVFDTAKIDQLGIVNLDDYVKYAPSISYVRGQGEGSNGQPGDAHVYIRGVVSGGDGNHSGSQPSVGIYFDELPVTTIDGTPDMHIYDVQRIEVLEGPQGTLFGASSESGTIRIISNQPDPTKFSAGYDLQVNQVDHGGTGWEAQGFVNLPLSPIAAVRLVAWDEHDAGFISNVAGTNASACIVNGVRTFPTWAGQTPEPYSCPTVGVLGAGAISNAASVKSDYNTVDTKGGRGALKFDLGENWTVTPTFMAQDLTTEGFFGYDPTVGDLQLVQFGPDNSRGLLVPDRADHRRQDQQFRHRVRRRLLQAHLAHGLRLQRLLGVLRPGVRLGGQLGRQQRLPIMPQEFVIGGGYFEKWSHELRISTPADEPVRATVGLFIERQLHDIWQDYTMPGYNGARLLAAIPTALPRHFPSRASTTRSGSPTSSASTGTRRCSPRSPGTSPRSGRSPAASGTTSTTIRCRASSVTRSITWRHRLRRAAALDARPRAVHRPQQDGQR